MSSHQSTSLQVTHGQNRPLESIARVLSTLFFIASCMLWIVSLRWDILYSTIANKYACAYLHNGCFELETNPPVPGMERYAHRYQSGWSVRRVHELQNLTSMKRAGLVLPRFSNPYSLRVQALVPLWMPALCSGAVSWYFWRHGSKKALPGFCRICKYCLLGNSSGICPECGARAGPPASVHCARRSLGEEEAM